MTPRRIAYVVNVFPKLSETFIAGEIAELRRRGVEVIILSLRKPTEELRHDIITEAGLDKLTVYEESKFSKILSEFQPDLIHAHFATEPTATARAFAAQLKIPFTFTTHGYDIRRKAPVDFRERAEAAAALITVSQANARHMTQKFDVGAGKITVIPCGIDTETFRPEKNNKGSADSVPLILCVARHAPVKNLAMLLRACAALRERDVKFRCALVGDGSCHGELKSLRAELNLEDCVEMPGATKQNEVVRWWQSADVGVLTSENEGMPVCLMEAAACGVPVVATDVGGIPELVQDKITGLLVPLNDVEKFSDALQRLIENVSLRKKMGVAARLRAEENFSVKRQVDSLLELWSGLLN